MQNFCEDCGAPLSPGVAFCENCGAKIAAETASSTHLASAAKAETNAGEQGIIYTNLNLLSTQLCIEKGALTEAINGFIADAAARGVSYSLVDVSSRFSSAATVAEHVAVIKDEVEKTHAKYLFILGSNTVIPSMVWTNEASDNESDADVASDLPYATLDTVSPFEGQKYDFEETLRVGRLPNVNLANYFANLKAGSGSAKDAATFAMSAEVWQNETCDIYKNISSQNVLTSPEYSKDNAAGVIPAETNTFLFNLHGSDETKYWYGQRGGSYPEAVEPCTFNGVSQPYFIAVEACYGAAYEGRTAEQSILLTTLGGKCISFLGSSRIAFGTPSAPGSCADIICCEYLKNLCGGMTAGDSLALARKELMKDRPDAETVKTLAEFALYGDPSARLKSSAAKKLFAPRVAEKSFPRGIRIPLPDVRNAVRCELCTVDEKIRSTVEAFVYRRYPEFEGTKAKYYRSTGGAGSAYNAVFSKAMSDVPVKNILSVSIGAGGQIKNILQSK